VERLVILGPGRIGLALGSALVKADAVGSILYYGRHPNPPEHPIFEERGVSYRYGIELPAEGTTAVLLTVPDDVLGEMAELLAARGTPPAGTVALHCSGSLGAEPLSALHHRGYQVGTLHPLQPIVNPIAGADRLFGASFALSGEPEALGVARRLVAALEGRGITVPTARRPLYHAAAVFASNYLVVLMRAAARGLEAAGASPDEAEAAILAMARGAIENAADRGIDAALTGPVRRGDVDVVGLHLRTLPEPDRALYVALGLHALEIAREDLEPEVALAMETLFRKYQ
jgi:predicted short-subunit dehydrogenase-like oxidoreductase (DUF2520 family)